MSDYETLQLDVEEGRADLAFSRPDKLNALNEQVLEELHTACNDLADRDDLRVVVLRGEGRAFIAGADIEAMVEMSESEARQFALKGHRTLDAVESIPVPVIAAVDGFALGGGLEVALACDLIYASARAAFGLPEVSLGIIPGFGGTQRLARFVGWQRARELVFTARQIDGDRADAIGLACDCLSVDDFKDRIDDVAETLASRGPLAVRAAKRVMRAGEDLSLEDGCQLERETFANLFETADAEEGMTAFVDGRDPNFNAE